MLINKNKKTAGNCVNTICQEISFSLREIDMNISVNYCITGVISRIQLGIDNYPVLALIIKIIKLN